MTVTAPGATHKAEVFTLPTVADVFGHTAARRSDEPALRTLGDATTLTWAEYARRVRRTAAGLAALGLRRGDSVACMLTNRPEFHVVDAAAMHLGAVSFSVYNLASPEQLSYVLTFPEHQLTGVEDDFRALAECQTGPCWLCRPRTSHRLADVIRRRERDPAQFGARGRIGGNNFASPCLWQRLN